MRAAPSEAELQAHFDSITQQVISIVLHRMSDQQAQRALRLGQEAMATVALAEDLGYNAFDPAVIAALHHQVLSLEASLGGVS